MGEMISTTGADFEEKYEADKLRPTSTSSIEATAVIAISVTMHVMASHKKMTGIFGEVGRAAPLMTRSWPDFKVTKSRMRMSEGAM